VDRKGKFSSQKVGRCGAQLPLYTRNPPQEEASSRHMNLMLIRPAGLFQSEVFILLLQTRNSTIESVHLCYNGVPRQSSTIGPIPTFNQVQARFCHGTRVGKKSASSRPRHQFQIVGQSDLQTLNNPGKTDIQDLCRRHMPGSTLLTGKMRGDT
jgi:hypothetical protein